ncbi:uncharacterized protein LOC135488003 [Lineus longissimus]|uniref:uncharacterized protein LOC135488003 n=1 Tax=Lineus longissimus TaxID=88925 RepID=UPI00315C8BE4
MQDNNVVCLPHEPLRISLDTKLAKESGDLPVQFAKTSQISSEASVKDISSRPDAQTLYQKVELKLDGRQQTFLMPMSVVSQSVGLPQPTMSRTVPLTPPKALQTAQGAAKMPNPEPVIPVVVEPDTENTLLKSEVNTNTVDSKEHSLSTKGSVSPRPLLPNHSLCHGETDGYRILQPLKSKRGRPKKSFSPVKKYKLMNEKRRCRVLKPKSDINSDDSNIGTIGLNGGTGFKNSSPLQQTGLSSKQADKVTNGAVPFGFVNVMDSSSNENLKTVDSVTSKPLDQEEPFLKIHSVYSLSTGPNACDFNDDAKIPNEKLNEVSECDQKNETLSCATEKVNGNITTNQSGHNPLSESDIPKEKKSRSLFSALSDLTELDTNDSSHLGDDFSINSADCSKTETITLNSKSEVSGCSHVGDSDRPGKGSNGDCSVTAKLTMNKHDIAIANEQQDVCATGAVLKSVAKCENPPSDSNLEKPEIDKSVTELPANLKNVNPDIIACAAGLKNILRGVSLESIQQVPEENCPSPDKTKPEIVPTPSVLKSEVEEMALKSKKVKGRSLADVVQSLSGGTSFSDSNRTGIREVNGEKQSDIEFGHDFNGGAVCDLSPEFDRQSPVIPAVDSLLTKPDIVTVHKPIKTLAPAEPTEQVDKKMDSILTESDKKGLAPGVEIDLHDKTDLKLTPQKNVNDGINEVFDAVLSADTCFDLGDFDSPTKLSAYEALSDPGDHELADVNSGTEDTCEPSRSGIADLTKNLKRIPLPVVEHDRLPAEEEPAQLEEGKMYPPENMSELYDATTEELDWSKDSSDSSIAPEDFRILQHAFSSYVALDDIGVALHGAKVINIGDLPLDVNLRFRRPSTLDGLKLSNENPERNLADNARRKQDIREWIETTKAADKPDEFESTSSSPLPPELEIEPATMDSDPTPFFKGISETPPEIDLVANKNDGHSFVKQSARKTFSDRSKLTLVKKRCVSRGAENLLKTVSHSNNNRASGSGKKKKGLNLAKEERRIKHIMRMREYRQKQKLKKLKGNVLSQELVVRSKVKQTVNDIEFKGDVDHQKLKEPSQKKARYEVTKGHKLSDEEKRLRNAFRAKEWRKKRKLLLMQGKADPSIQSPNKRRKLISGEEVPLECTVGGSTLEKTIEGVVRFKAEEVCKSSDAVTEFEIKADFPCIVNGEHARSASDTTIAEEPKRKRGRPSKTKGKKKSLEREDWKLNQKGQVGVRNRTTFSCGAGDTEKNNQSRILKHTSEVTDGPTQGDVFSFKSDSSVEGESTDAFSTNFVHTVTTESSTQTRKKKGTNSRIAILNKKAKYSREVRNRLKVMNSSKDDWVASAGECSECPSSEPRVLAIKRDQIKRGRGRPRKDSMDCTLSPSFENATMSLQNSLPKVLDVDKDKGTQSDLTNVIGKRRNELLGHSDVNSLMVSPASAMSVPIPPESLTKSKIKDTELSSPGPTKHTQGCTIANAFEYHVELSPIPNTDIAAKGKKKYLNKSEPAPFDMNSNIVSNTEDTSKSMNISQPAQKVQVKRGRGRPRKNSLDGVPLASSRVSSTMNEPVTITVLKDQSKSITGQNSWKQNSLSAKETNSKDSVRVVPDADDEVSLSGNSGAVYPKILMDSAVISPMCPQKTQPMAEKRKRGRPFGRFKKCEKIEASNSPDITDVSAQLTQVDEAKQQVDAVDENHLWGKEDLTVDASFEEEPVQSYEMSMNESDDFYLSMSVTSPPMSPVQKRTPAPVQPNPCTKGKASNNSEKETAVSEVPVHVPAPPVLTPEDHAYKLKVLMDKLKSQNEELDKLRAQQK